MSKYGWPEERVDDVVGDLVHKRNEVNASNAELTARVAELESEVSRYRKALADVAKESWNIDSDQGDKIREVIRNVLKGWA